MINKMAIELLKDNLHATRGVTGNGTVATRLWHCLTDAVGLLEKENKELVKLEKEKDYLQEQNSLLEYELAEARSC